MNATEITCEGTAGIWRYMDFTKYVSMLETESLYFCRADRFEDPYEGIPHPSLVEEQRESMWPLVEFDSNLAQTTWEQLDLKTKYEKARSHVLINCWHENDYESAAMWSLYLSSPEGIAVRSTTEQLKNSIDGNTEVRIERVEYVDFRSSLKKPDKAKSMLSDSLKPFCLKRKSFSHEHEIRALFEVKRPPEHGLACKVQLDVLIESIHVSPLAPNWFFSLVKSVNQRYDMTQKPILKSSLYNAPEIQVAETVY